MTTTIKIRFNDDPQTDDDVLSGRLKKRLPLLEKVMERSAKPFEVKERPLYNNHGDVVETEFIFYVDEFYEDIVMNLVNGLGMDGSEWSDWFTEKYKL